jgi:hypothetical protein
MQAKLANAANAYQTFSPDVWSAIVARTTEVDMRAVHQATQVASLNDSVAFLQEANAGRLTSLAAFTDQVSQWAANQE